ncbi:DoxX family protein [Cognatiyoonia sp. IB215182]|uniref:DoxX family protein n=1 Tax=Cognatiyoonia sp. IB215182 TaxID=3097353 RepID=UPI002A137846|nr:DoxX family protein [Cognatiyoonia sp. IB215182]MDX8353173.1 DoxX family protein [Cognatiyoonia sp. IB215182]
MTSLAHAHEAWLLTPAEIAALAQEPIPAIFTSYAILGLAAVVGCVATLVALLVEERLRPHFQPLEPLLQSVAANWGPALLRIPLGVMLVLAGTGGLPRHGTAHWVEPTLLVPDMQLALVPGWDWLAPFQITLGLCLIAGLFTRIAGLVLMALVVLGWSVFGIKFIDYAPHFVAPAIVLTLVGGGVWSVDRLLQATDWCAPPAEVMPVFWRAAQILVGFGFVYLAVAYKLTQPTLLIAILQHGNLPTFGLHYAVIALIMTGVEIICGALLIAGRLVRPVSVVIILAITFLAVTLGETPLFHANLYGMLAMFVIIGTRWRTPQTTIATGKVLA